VQLKLKSIAVFELQDRCFIFHF